MIGTSWLTDNVWRYQYQGAWKQDRCRRPTFAMRQAPDLCMQIPQPRGGGDGQKPVQRCSARQDTSRRPHRVLPVLRVAIPFQGPGGCIVNDVTPFQAVSRMLTAALHGNCDCTALSKPVSCLVYNTCDPLFASRTAALWRCGSRAPGAQRQRRRRTCCTGSGSPSNGYIDLLLNPAGQRDGGVMAAGPQAHGGRRGDRCAVVAHAL